MTQPLHSFSFEVRSAQHLAELVSSSLPLGIVEGKRSTSRHRDLYLDTEDDMLRRRSITCRLRISADDTRYLSLRIGNDSDSSETRFDSRVTSADPAQAVAEDTSTGRRLSALVDPARLGMRLEIETDRTTRFAGRDWLRRFRGEIHYDRSVAHRNGISSTVYKMCLHARRGDEDFVARLAEAMEEQHGLRSTTERTRERAELMLKWKRGKEAEPDAVRDGAAPKRERAVTEFLNPELSLLAFQSRVLSLAENAATPLYEKLRFLSIVSSNLDEFFMIRVAGLKQAAREQSEEQCDDGLTRAEQMNAISDAIADLVRRQSACAAQCLGELELDGLRIMKWDELGAAEREELRRQCIEEINPDLTPMAMTLSPGHPMPHLPHLTLALAVTRRDPHTKRLHLAELELPSDAARFFSVPGTTSVITLEEVVRSNIDLVHPAGGTEGVYAFRVTRGGELALDEEAADDLIEAMSHASERRLSNPAVRVEVERDMPDFVRNLLITNLQREEPAVSFEAGDIHEVDGLLDLTCLSRLALPDNPQRVFPAFEPVAPSITQPSVFEMMKESDLLFHHPFDSFADSVLRFLTEAAEDPDVTTIRITLYRLGSSSAVADALIRAAKRGKKVIAFVELKARFDEHHNVGWARKLEKAGGHVISGLVGVKNHAKVAMVVRREGHRLKTYVHVGTGNYNSKSAKEYTDFSLLSTREDVTQDAGDLFNALTGGSLPPRGLTRGSLIAPHQMADALIAMIDREAANARAGLPSGITAKVNGLSDPHIVRALLRASGDGVPVVVACRGICTLRPGVPGISERIRIVSHVGRFLEHSRVYRFANAGEPAYFIGSADLRHRNLRRRVELLVPVRQPAQARELDRILELYLEDESAWELRSDGTYVQREAGVSRAQSILATGRESSGARPDGIPDLFHHREHRSA